MTNAGARRPAAEPVIDVIVGVSDGLVIPFALATGISRITTDNFIVIGWVLSAIFVGAIAMALARYYGAKEQEDNFEKEHKVYAQLELDTELVRTIAEETKQNKEQWEELAARYDVEAAFDAGRARTSAFNIAIAYAAGGLIPLTPYFFTSAPADGFQLSVAVTIVCLLVFGFLKARYTSQNAVATVSRYILTGAAAAIAAYFLAGLFI